MSSDSVQKTHKFRDFMEEAIRHKLSQKDANDLFRKVQKLSRWSWDIELVPEHRRGFYDRIAFAALFSFLTTFSIVRTFSYLFPTHVIFVQGVHVHHFIFGIILLAISGFLSLISFSPTNKIWLAMFYGMNLGFVADEAGQWLRLQDDYWVRQSYDAIIIVSLALVLIIYLPRYMRIFYKPLKKAPDAEEEFLEKEEKEFFADVALAEELVEK